jgi:uncharacterized membrane protein YobD (UPF0266 family)
VIHSLLESSNLKNVVGYYKNTKFSLPRNYIHYNREILQMENRIMYFAYLYIEYADMHTMANRKAKFWDSCFVLLKAMS